MAFIFGVATREGELYKIMRDFLTGRGRPGQIVAAGTGNGKVNNLIFPEGSAAIYETLTLTCVSAATKGGTFGVIGSVSGVLPDAVVGQVYKQPLVEFYIDFGTVDYAVGDTFTISTATIPVGKTGFTYLRGMPNAKTEVITLTCTQSGQPLVPGVQPNVPAIFNVVGSVNGALPDLTQGVEYTSPVFRFLLTANSSGSNQFVTGDVITVKTTINELRAVNQQWESLRQTAAVGPTNGTQFGFNVDDADTELVLRGPGLSQADNIYWGMTRAWSNANASAWWTHFAMTGYVPTMSMPEQPTVQGGQAGVRPNHTFWSLQIPYVIIANGRCFKIITRSNIYYSQSYAGFFLPSTLPKYLGYPYLIGGTGDNRNTLWSSLPSSRSAFWDYQGDTAGGSAYALNESTTWDKLYGLDEGGQARMTYNRIEPYGMDGVYDLRNNLDGSVPSFQVQLSPNRGFVDGVYAIPGRDGRQPEEIILMRDGRRALVSQNHHRSGFGDFCAFILE